MAKEKPMSLGDIIAMSKKERLSCENCGRSKECRNCKAGNSCEYWIAKEK